MMTVMGRVQCSHFKCHMKPTYSGDPRPGADPENCFGRGTLDLRLRQSETPNALRDDVGQRVYPSPAD